MTSQGDGRGEADAAPTVVGPSDGERALVRVGFPLLGAGVGWLLLSVAEWVTSLPWAPLQGPFELAASIADHPLATPGALVVGAAAGLVLTVVAVREELTVTVTDEEVTLARVDSSRRFDRPSVHAVFLDGKRLVLLDTAAGELAREKADLNPQRLREAFVVHGFPWTEEDPYSGEFRRWVEGTPGLPVGADALLRAREKALRDDDTRDAAELRTELARLGVVVREEQTRQYWRRSRPDGSAGTHG